MQKKTIAIIAFAVCSLIAGIVLTSHAQWDNDEEVQRLEQKQWDAAEQGGTDETEATGIATPPSETKSEKVLGQWEDIPTGYLRRVFVIRQLNLAGTWEDADIFPAQGYESAWHPMNRPAYESAVSSGLRDAALKGTAYGPYYENMRRLCGSAPDAKDVHIKSPSGSTQWKVGQRLQRPYTLYRELRFECLVKTHSS